MCIPFNYVKFIFKYFYQLPSSITEARGNPNSYHSLPIHTACKVLNRKMFQSSGSGQGHFLPYGGTSTDNKAAMTPLPAHTPLKVPFSSAIASEQQAANRYVNRRNTSKTNGF